VSAAPDGADGAVGPVGFRTRVAAASADVRAAVDALPFLAALGDGTLDPAVFRHYLEQDGCYLREYTRALALLAARAPRTDDAEVWAGSAAAAVVAERELHADLLGHPLLARTGEAGDGPSGASRPSVPVRPSPTTLGYASWLVARAATAPYAVAAAAVLPCFTVYAEVGHALAARSSQVPDNPFARWTAAYADPAFQAASAAAADVVERAVADAPGDADEAVATAVLATRYEWAFWDAAWRREGWPV
jgi:thiaminase/transcriptional activator TenA